MNDQERQIISDIFKRLEQTAGQQRDPEAERFIAEKLRTQPYAPYAMAQALYVQEEAMKSLNQQLEQLKAENEQLHQQASQGSGGGGILSSIFGGGQKSQPAGSFSRPGAQPGYGAQQPQYAPQQPQYAPQQGGPWGGAPQGGQGGPWGGQPQAAAAPGGGGFLKGALTTAAGVAGGMVVGNALMNAFSGGHHALGGLSGSDMASFGGGGDTIVENNYFGSDQGGGFGNAGFDQGGPDQGFDQGGGDAGFQDASFDPGGDVGGDDDSSWT